MVARWHLARATSSYMGSSVTGQDDLNRALWLATRAGKMEPSCPLGNTRCIPQAKLPRKPYNKSFIDQVCSVKMAGYWPRSFSASLWTSTSSPSLNTHKKELGQYPVILTSHLVNNPYLRHSRHVFGTCVHKGLLKHIPRLRFWCVIITTLYQLMLQSWYQKTAQSLVNTLVLFRHSEIFSYGILISRMKCNFWQSLNKFCTWGSELP